MRLDRSRTAEALACADRWSADTVDGVAALPWAAAVTGGQARRWLAALYDLGWRPPEREPVTTEELLEAALPSKVARARAIGLPVTVGTLMGLGPADGTAAVDWRRWR